MRSRSPRELLGELASLQPPATTAGDELGGFIEARAALIRELGLRAPGVNPELVRAAIRAGEGAIDLARRRLKEIRDELVQLRRIRGRIRQRLGAGSGRGGRVNRTA